MQAPLLLSTRADELDEFFQSKPGDDSHRATLQDMGCFLTLLDWAGLGGRISSVLKSKLLILVGVGFNLAYQMAKTSLLKNKPAADLNTPTFIRMSMYLVAVSFLRIRFAHFMFPERKAHAGDVGNEENMLDGLSLLLPHQETRLSFEELIGKTSASYGNRAV
jgi:hypothetical protein